MKLIYIGNESFSFKGLPRLRLSFHEISDFGGADAGGLPAGRAAGAIYL